MADYNTKKSRMSLTLSSRTGEMISQLRASTDADSDSEVVRNSIRLAFSVLTAAEQGSRVFVESPDGERTAVSLAGMSTFGTESNAQVSRAARSVAEEMAERVALNAAEVQQLVDYIKDLINDTSEQVRGKNSLTNEQRQEALEALSSLSEVVSEVAVGPAGDHKGVSQEQFVHPTWPQRFRIAIARSLEATFDADNIAEAILPTGIIVACGALGAIVAGSVGFGAGSVLGHLLTGQIKPSSAAKQIRELRSGDNE